MDQQLKQMSLRERLSRNFQPTRTQQPVKATELSPEFQRKCSFFGNYSKARPALQNYVIKRPRGAHGMGRVCDFLINGGQDYKSLNKYL